MEPWFAWFWPMGIRPIHPNGWVAVGIFFIAAIPLMFVSVGAFNLGPIVQNIATVTFLAASIAFFALVFWRLEEREY